MAMQVVYSVPHVQLRVFEPGR